MQRLSDHDTFRSTELCQDEMLELATNNRHEGNSKEVSAFLCVIGGQLIYLNENIRGLTKVLGEKG